MAWVLVLPDRGVTLSQQIINLSHFTIIFPNRLISLLLCTVLALQGGLSFIVQNQQLLYLSSKAPAGLRLICTGSEMRWISTAESETQGELVFVSAPGMSPAPEISPFSATNSAPGTSIVPELHHGPGKHANHAEHEPHSEHDSHSEQVAHQHHEHDKDHPALSDTLPHAVGVTDLACPDQVFSELQQSLGLFASAIVSTFANKVTPCQALPEAPYTCVPYRGIQSRAPPANTV